MSPSPALSSPALSTPPTELGAVPTAGGTRFTVWTTTARDVAVRLFRGPDAPVRTVPLTPRGEGIFEGVLADVGPGALYKLVLDDREVSDPYARFLPHGVLGPARVEARVAPPARGRFVIPPPSRWVIYELHLGTFTPEGTWRAARERLSYLRSLGVNAIEIMPIAAFAGSRGWGYDGVALFAPFAGYGEPDDLRAFVGAAHEHGLAVILDVVYNHFGPAGNYLADFAPEYFTSAHKTAWGDAPAFDEPRLRELVASNARYWLEEMGFDALRLDATHAIADDSDRHILSELASLAKSLEPRRYLLAEDERNEPALVTKLGLDAVWADDFHHVVHAVVTGEQDGYYGAYAPNAATLARTIERGWCYEGETFAPWGKPRGKSAKLLEAARFVYCIQNHDQVGNRAFGERLGQLAGAEAQCAAAMLLLFLPMVPMLFMGEEWGATTPFLFFTDHRPELGEAITRGRREEFKRFASFDDPAARARIPDPQAPSTFEASRLRWEERERPEHARVLALYRKMLSLRATDPVFSFASREGLSCEAHGDLLVARRSGFGEARTLLLNCGSSALTAPLSLTEENVLATSWGAVSQETREIPPRGAVLLRGVPNTP